MTIPYRQNKRSAYALGSEAIRPKVLYPNFFVNICV